MEKPFRVLVIEDEEPIRMFLSELLTEEGFSVMEAVNGIDGVTKTFSESPDIVLTDICMPDMDGIAYLKRVRSQIPVDRLPIIVVSAFGMEEKVVEAFRAGATDYLVKPFRQNELLARMDVALKKRIDPRRVVLGEQKGPEQDFAENVSSGSSLDLGKYRIIEEIGAGGMGTIYKALHVGYGNELAVKVLDVKKARDRASVMRFLREVRIASQMDHPNIVRVFDVGLSGSHYYYAMELLPGRSLYAEVKNRGPIPERRVARIGMQLASALSSMHHHGFMHRDVKPDNVIMIDDDNVKLIDFGLACSIDDSRLTREGTFVGTPGYVAPEMIQKYQAPDEKGDIYSLGATLYLAKSGKSPFPSTKGPTQKIESQVVGRPIPLTTADRSCDENFAKVVMKMISRDPRNRFENMTQVMDALKQLEAQGEPGASATPATLRANGTFAQ